jgi:hypothetical protein
MPFDGSLVITLHKWIEIFMRHSMQHFIRYSRESGISMSQLGTLFHIHRMGFDLIRRLFSWQPNG